MKMNAKVMAQKMPSRKKQPCIPKKSTTVGNNLTTMKAIAQAVNIPSVITKLETSLLSISEEMTYGPGPIPKPYAIMKTDKAMIEIQLNWVTSYPSVCR